jgi:hypothetical protein
MQAQELSAPGLILYGVNPTIHVTKGKLAGLKTPPDFAEQSKNEDKPEKSWPTRAQRPPNQEDFVTPDENAKS